MPWQTPSNDEVRNLAKKPKPSVVATPCLFGVICGGQKVKSTKSDGSEKPFAN
jgi:hypothetical protein